MSYPDLVLKHFKDPQNVGCFSDQQATIAQAKLGTLGVGDVVQLQILVDEQGYIRAAKFKAYGNPYTIAGLSWLTTQLTDLSLAEAKKIDHRLIAETFALPAVKLQSALLIEDVLTATLNHYLGMNHE